jgi:hypothetical protein
MNNIMNNTAGKLSICAENNVNNPHWVVIGISLTH